jgi:hypothetical protein
VLLWLLTSDKAGTKSPEYLWQNLLLKDRYDLHTGEAISVTGCGGPYNNEVTRLPHFLDNQLTDGGEVVSLTHQLPFPQEDSWYSFLLQAELNSHSWCSWKD